MIVLASYSLSIYIPTAQACPSTRNNKSLLLLLFSILLQHEPSHLSDAAEIQDIAEALSYRVLLFSSSSISRILSLSSQLPPPRLSDLPRYHLFYLLHSVLSSTLPKKLSPSLSFRLLILHPQKVRCSFQKLLQNVQCRSNPIQNPPSLHLN